MQITAPSPEIDCEFFGADDEPLGLVAAPLGIKLGAAGLIVTIRALFTPHRHASVHGCRLWLGGAPVTVRYRQPRSMGPRDVLLSGFECAVNPVSLDVVP